MYSLLKFIYNALVNTDESSDIKINKSKLNEQYKILNEQCELYDKAFTENEIPIENIEKSDCFKKDGVITSLESFNGIINDSICFDLSAAKDLSDQLTVGCKVSYLAYKFSDDIQLKVVKIISVNNQVWEKPSKNQVLNLASL